MKYVLLMQFSVADWKANNTATWTPEQVRANGEFLRQFNEDLDRRGELVDTQGLGGPEGIRVVVAGKDGTPAVTDGPFAETKEFLAGYVVVDVESPERAIELAARLSAMPGPVGEPSRVPIEVRALLNHRADDW